jgi:hypothetical protein
MIRWFGLLCSVFPTSFVVASMILPLSSDEQFRQAAGVYRATVVSFECFVNPADHGIYTRTLLRVQEALKGDASKFITVVQRGGQIGHKGEMDGSSPTFQPGEERLLFLSRRGDGALSALQGAASTPRLTRLHGRLSTRDDALLRTLRQKAGTTIEFNIDAGDQITQPTLGADIAASPFSSATNLLSDVDGVSSRFTAPDRGEAIPYLVDADALPAGITLGQALLAVQQALEAWSNVTSLRFTFEGLASFGTAPANIDVDDGKLRIQLHDLYGFITEPQVLGKGGRSYYTSPPDVATWGFGGNVKGSEFHRTIAGYVTLEHTAASLQTLTTFTEVLCHEIGHALSMAHSSENPNEPWPDWCEAIMYYRAHADGRGATLGAYDPRVISQVFPSANTPPYSYDRVMDIITQSSGTPNVAGINEIEAKGYDLQGSLLALQTAGSSTSEFSVVGDRIKFTPSDFFEEPRIDPASGGYYAVIYLRHSDGTNASALASVRVVSFLPDGSTSDGMPNAWMTAYFGTTVGTGNRAPGADFDGDGLTNLQEYILGTDPNDGSSGLRITGLSVNTLQFPAKPYELYEVYGSTDLITWTRVINPIVPSVSPATASGLPTLPGNQQFFRVLKVQ